MFNSNISPVSRTVQPMVEPGVMGSSFSDYLQAYQPDYVSNRLRGASAAGAPHGTTIVAVSYAGGVLIAADRRATMGNLIASDTIEKVFIVDRFSAVGFAGTVGIAMELVRLFTIEIEHYEKIEGTTLSFAGKANRLADMLRRNFPLAQQGLSAAPMLIGVDEPEVDATDRDSGSLGQGKIVSYDVVGGTYVDDQGYSAIGSGSLFARSALKKLYHPQLSRLEALSVAVQALSDAAEDDSATAGPNTFKKIYPTAVTIDSTGSSYVTAEVIEKAVQARHEPPKRTRKPSVESAKRTSTRTSKGNKN